MFAKKDKVERGSMRQGVDLQNKIVVMGCIHYTPVSVVHTICRISVVHTNYQWLHVGVGIPVGIYIVTFGVTMHIRFKR
jgi:hypothetical protein